MAEDLKKMQNYSALGVNLSRQKYGPLDVSNVFYSLNDFKWYLSYNSKAETSGKFTKSDAIPDTFKAYPYEGQIIAVDESGVITVYVLGVEKSEATSEGLYFDYNEVGSKTLGDGNSIDLVDGELSIHGFADAKNKYVPYKDETAGKIIWGAVSGLIPEAIVPVSDNETIDVSQDPDDDTKYIVSIKGKSGAVNNSVLRKHIAEDNTVTYTWDEIYSKAEADTELANKVDKEDGKSLVSDTEITKLAGVSEGANKVAASTVNGQILVDGASVTVYTAEEGTVVDKEYQHVTVSATDGVTAGSVTYKYDDSALAGRVETIENDYLKAADKTELQGNIDKKQDTLSFDGTYDASTNKVVTQSSLKSAIDAVKQFRYEIVTTLPEASEANMGKIFLYKPTETATSYEEYIVVDQGESADPRYKLEKIGDTDIKLTNYYTKSETDAELAKKQDVISATNTISADYIADGTTNKAYTAAEQTKLAGIEEGAEANKLEGVQVAGNDLDISDKKVNIALGDGLAYDTTNKVLKLDLGSVIINGGDATISE